MFRLKNRFVSVLVLILLVSQIGSSAVADDDNYNHTTVFISSKNIQGSEQLTSDELTIFKDINSKVAVAQIQITQWSSSDNSIILKSPRKNRIMVSVSGPGLLGFNSSTNQLGKALLLPTSTETAFAIFLYGSGNQGNSEIEVVSFDPSGNREFESTKKITFSTSGVVIPSGKVALTPSIEDSKKSFPPTPESTSTPGGIKSDCKTQEDANKKIIDSLNAEIISIKEKIRSGMTNRVATPTLKSIVVQIARFQLDLRGLIAKSPNCLNYKKDLEKTDSLRDSLNQVFSMLSNEAVFEECEQDCSTKVVTDYVATLDYDGDEIQEGIILNPINESGFSTVPRGKMIISIEGKKRVIGISTTISNKRFRVLAIKKGSKSIEWTLRTDSQGSLKISTNRSLQGFMVTLYFDGKQLFSLPGI
jgi:hypothetical protein